MPSGIQTFNASGGKQFDIDLITSRVIGSLVVTSTPSGGSVQAVPVTANKQLWVFYYVVGAIVGKVVRNSPTANSFTYYATGTGTMYIFYGEC